MPQINRPPKGLNDFLQLHSKGLNPNQLADTIIPTIDVGRFVSADLLLQSAFVTSGYTAAATPNHFATITVPNGELWDVRAISVEGNPNSTSAIFAVGLQDVNQVGSDAVLTNFASLVPEPLTGLFIQNATFTPGFEFLVGSGVTMGAWMRFATGNGSVTTRVLYYKLTV